MKGKVKVAIGIVVVMLLAAIVPATTYTGTHETKNFKMPLKINEEKNSITENDKIKAYELDHYRRLGEDDSNIATAGPATEQNDAGYWTDVGNDIRRALPIYPGEAKDGAPGRGTTGQLAPPSDKDDWYYFSVCEGQKIDITLNPESNYDLALANADGDTVATSENSGTSTESISYTADTTGNWYLHIYAASDGEKGNYTFSVTVSGQNDAGSGHDAGNSINSALHIDAGTYDGYLDMNDWEDWYSFDVSSGQGIKVTLEAPYNAKSDCDIHLYNPDGELVYSAMYYGDDTLEYPADESGTWAIKIDLWPGWDTSKWPDNYFLYGSGAYTFTLELGGSVNPPPGPVPQPDITPVAQTFIVNNDPNSNKDEYAYIAAVPAANYIENGKRYVSPVIYKGDSTPTHWFGVVDDTTQYLLDDWNTYLARHGMTAVEYTLPDDPVKAAAYIATTKWSKSTTAVIAPDGSEFQDDVQTVIDQDATLSISTKVTNVAPGSSKFKDVGGVKGVPMFVGSKWGAIQLFGEGDGFRGDTGVITPRYESTGEDWWPHPYDVPGNDEDTFIPITIPGLWIPYVTNDGGLENFKIVLYSGQRYKIPVDTTDCSINVTITTSEPSNLIVFLIDPYGNIRKPDMPHWNGGKINPVHIWNGGHWHGIGFDEWRNWKIPEHTTFSVQVNHPMTGKWTAIVVPYKQTSGSVSYHITATIRTYNPKRIDAGLSATNAAVIASLMHAPLLYVKEDSVPSETSDALTKLGATNLIFVNINKVSTASLSGSVTEYNTMQDVVNAIKADSHSENVITITSWATGKGYFAPAAMIAAYHGSPVLNIGEAAGAYDTLDKAMVWREYAGDYYHGCLSLGHLPHMSKPFDFWEMLQDLIKNKNLPGPGFDLKKRWFTQIHDGIYGNLTAKYGLDLEGKEAYIFVSPRDFDIRDLVCRAMTGNLSYAGQIPMVTPALDADLICRDILYPAIIFANPGRNVTTSQLMNFPDGSRWTTNDGKSHSVYSSRAVKESFSSHGRFYEGHCVFENWLERMNEGVCINYYSGHGTGGSGVSFQYRNVAEEFPYAELRHEELKNFNWWDAWRGYMYDDKQIKSPRWGGFTWYNAEEPNLYDIVHFKYIDQYLENLHSEVEAFMSCTTAAHFGPMIYLEHGSALYYGNAGTGLCPQEDLLDDSWMHDALVYGEPVGEAFSKYVWLHQRDYTTGDPTAMYGSSSMAVTNVQLFFGDPTLIVYSPEWQEPTPIAP
ncbi:MAG: PPC domain-containing protein [Thermoplasmata archaeon]|nr:PPC domain-containing protein [Thermoplasmata archaeon]